MSELAVLMRKYNHMVPNMELEYLNTGPEKAKKGSGQGARCPCSLLGRCLQEVWLIATACQLEQLDYVVETLAL